MTRHRFALAFLISLIAGPAVAERFIERARRVAESLELGVASANGVLLGKGERYRREA